MADEKKPTDGKKEAPKPAPLSPEAEATARINGLRESVKALEGEIKMLSGKLINRDPAQAAALQKENKILQDRLARLQKALYGLLMEAGKPRQPEDLKAQVEILGQASVEFCKKANINPELWKNIAS